MTALFTQNLAENRLQLARALRWPENVGIFFRDITLPTAPAVAGLLVWVDQMADDQRIGNEILAYLDVYRGTPDQAAVAAAIPVPEQETTADREHAVRRVLDGFALLLLEGWQTALLVNVVGKVMFPSLELPQSTRDIFSQDLRLNLGLLRQRVRDPRLLAQRVQLRRKDRGEVVLLHVEGEAMPPLVRLVRQWAACHSGEAAMQRGLSSTAGTVFGIVPRFDASRWPDDLATLLGNGYVVLLVDRVAVGFVAPVSAAFWTFSVGDLGIPFPVRRWLHRIRVLFYLGVLVLPGSLVALMNYHVDMLPTSFLAAITSVRENAPFGTLFEVLMLEALVEIGREVSMRLPVGVTPGTMAVTISVIILLMVQSGLVGPLPAIGAVVGSLCSLALPSYGGAYLVRVWRYYLLIAAAILGFFGMAGAFAILAAYLTRARPWSIPVIGPAGVNFSAPEGQSSRPGRRKGGKTAGKRSFSLR
jgi:spore germination protein KA